MPKPYHLRACSPRIEARNKKLAGRANGDGGPCLCLGMKASSASSRPPVRPRVRTLPYRYAVAFSSEPRLLLLLAPPALPRGKPEPGWMRHPPTDTAASPRSARAPPPLLVAAVARAAGSARAASGGRKGKAVGSPGRGRGGGRKRGSGSPGGVARRGAPRPCRLARVAEAAAAAQLCVPWAWLAVHKRLLFFFAIAVQCPQMSNGSEKGVSARACGDG